MNDKQPIKMYVLIKKSLPSHKIVVAANASVACYLRFQDRPEMVEWAKNGMKTVVCEVTDREFEAAKCEENHVVVKSAAWKDVEAGLAFKPRMVWPEEFRFYSLMRL